MDRQAKKPKASANSAGRVQSASMSGRVKFNFPRTRQAITRSPARQQDSYKLRYKITYRYKK